MRIHVGLVLICFTVKVFAQNSTNVPIDNMVTMCSPSYQNTIYRFNMTTLEGNFIPFSRFRNMVVLVVNVASFCQYTPQYIQLNQLMKQYGPSDLNYFLSNEPTSPNTQSSILNSCHLQILGFPSNLFHRQEPGYTFEIKNCLYHVRPGNGFIPVFPLSLKIDVNGDKQPPLYTFLKENCSTKANLANETCSLWSPLRNNDIVGNFEKILVDHLGYPSYRFPPMVEPLQISSHIEKLIKKCKDEIHANNLVGTVDLNNTKYENYLPPQQNTQ